MSPIDAGGLAGSLLAHQSQPIGFVLVLVPLVVLGVALRVARIRAQRRLDATTPPSDEPSGVHE